MTLLTTRRRPEDRIPTSSMADIAFLLLIFFLVTTVFPKDRGLALVLPEESPPIDVRPDNILFLFVGGGGRVEVKQGAAQQTFLLGVDAIQGLWRERVAERPGLIAAIRPSPDASYGSMIDVLDALQTAGARRISLQLDTR